MKNLKNTTKKSFFYAILLILTAGPSLAYAAEDTRLGNPITSDSFEEFLNRLLDILIVFATPVYALMIAIAGFTFVTGSGTPEKRKKALNIMKYSTIGFVIILLGKAVVALVRSLL